MGVSPRQSPRQSPTSSPIPMRKRITKAGSPQDTTDYVTIETSQVSMHTTPVGTGATTQARSVSPELPDLQSMPVHYSAGVEMGEDVSGGQVLVILLE